MRKFFQIENLEKIYKILKKLENMKKINFHFYYEWSAQVPKMSRVPSEVLPIRVLRFRVTIRLRVTIVGLLCRSFCLFHMMHIIQIKSQQFRGSDWSSEIARL
jgi:hypothetical protein